MTGQRSVSTVHGEAVADIVAHATRARWAPGAVLRRELATRAADPGLDADLAAVAGAMLDEV